MLGFVPAVDELDRCLALLQLLFGHFQVLETAAGCGKRFDGAKTEKPSLLSPITFVIFRGTSPRFSTLLTSERVRRS
jgi:hypothetical protein